MAEHLHPPEELNRPADTPVDAGSQALAEALRSSFGIVKFVMFVLVCVFLGSGFFTVGPQERAIIIRLGRPVGDGEKALLGPGLHWSWPYPIDEYVKVPITSIQKVRSTVGWYLATPEAEQTGTDYGPYPVTTPINSLVDGYILTADKNIVHSRATLTYHIDKPVDFIFNFVNASNMVQSALDNALLAAASSYRVDDILTRDLAGFKDAVRKRVVAQINAQELGVVVEECVVDSRAPRQLIDPFRSVVDAEVRRGRVLNEARSYEAQVMSKGSADAKSKIDTAESERVRLVNDIASQAERFKDLLPKYRENPNLFTQQRLAEVLARVLAGAQEKIFVTQGSEGKPKELRLLLNREPPKKTEEPKP
jgi:membrane protease subunit HflK